MALSVELLKHPDDLAASVGVQSAGGLVGEDDRRVAHQSTGNGHTLLLAAGELVGQVFELIPQTHLFQHFLRHPVAFGAGDIRVNQRHLHVLHQVEAGQKVILLEDETQHLVAHICQLVSVHLAHVPAVEPVGAVGGDVQTADDVHAGGLARTGLAHDGHELPLLDLHRDVVGGLYQRIAHLIILAHLLKFDQSAHGAPPYQILSL